MMTFLLSLLTSRLAGPIASVVAVVALGLAVSQCSGRVKAERAANKAEAARIADVAKAEAKVRKAEADYSQCKVNRITLDDARKSQNAAVAAIKADADRKLKEASKAVSAARSVAESHRREAARILAAKPKGDACSAADALVLEVVG